MSCKHSAGTSATTCSPGKNHIRQILQACDALPLNFGFTGQGCDSSPEALREQIVAGACGLKVHEDRGATPAAIDSCLDVCDELDVQCCIHTDTLNESGFVQQTVAAFKGRTIHTYHTEGAGGGHAPDIISVVELPNVLPASTNPTRPFTKNTLDEHLDMLMVCHHLSKNIPEDVAFAESRIRAETIAAEDVLQDMGAISIMSSDSQAMGRCGEVILRTWNTAHKNKTQRGRLPEDQKYGGGKADNFRVRRYISKYTINPALAQGFSHLIGSIEVGKLADLVLWDPAWFGTKPSMVIKGGFIAWAQMVCFLRLPVLFSPVFPFSFFSPFSFRVRFLLSGLFSIFYDIHLLRLYCLSIICLPPLLYLHSSGFSRVAPPPALPSPFFPPTSKHVAHEVADSLWHRIRATPTGPFPPFNRPLVGLCLHRSCHRPRSSGFRKHPSPRAQSPRITCAAAWSPSATVGESAKKTCNSTMPCPR